MTKQRIAAGARAGGGVGLELGVESRSRSHRGNRGGVRRGEGGVLRGGREESIAAAAKAGRDLGRDGCRRCDVARLQESVESWC